MIFQGPFESLTFCAVQPVVKKWQPPSPGNLPQFYCSAWHYVEYPFSQFGSGVLILSTYALWQSVFFNAFVFREINVRSLDALNVLCILMINVEKALKFKTKVLPCINCISHVVYSFQTSYFWTYRHHERIQLSWSYDRAVALLSY